MLYIFLLEICQDVELGTLIEPKAVQLLPLLGKVPQLDYTGMALDS